MRHRLQIWICLAFLLALMAFCVVSLGRFSNDLSAMFPGNSRTGRMYGDLRRLGLTEAIQLDFDCGGEGAAEDYGEALIALADELASLPGIARVRFIMLDTEALNMARIVQALPMTADASILDKADAAAAANGAALALSMPGVPIAPLRADPFGLGVASLRRLEAIGSLGGFKGKVSNRGFLVDNEGRHALMLLQASKDECWDAMRTRRLFDEIGRIASTRLPAEVVHSIVSPLRHGMENEETVRRDVLHVSIVTAAVLVLLFVLVYRRAWEALWIPLLPFGATLMTVGLFSVFCCDVCLSVLGIGGAIAGLAVDQGIHVYAAYHGEDGEGRLMRIFRPLFLSMLTSSSVFLALLASGVKAYMQLGVFAACTLSLNFVLSYFALPTLLPRCGGLPDSGRRVFSGGRHPTLICILWAAVLLAGFFSVREFRPQFALNALDGSGQGTFREEMEFNERWRNSDAGIPAVLCGDDEDDLYLKCEELRARLGMPEELVFHPGQIWPSRRQRTRFLETWKEPRAKARLAELREALRRELAARSLPPEFFRPFFEAIERGIDENAEAQASCALESVAEYCTSDAEDGKAAMMVFIPKSADFAGRERQEEWIIRQFPFVSLASPTAFQAAVHLDMRPRLLRVGLCIALALLLILYGAYRSFSSLLVVALPGLTAFLAFSLLLAITGIKPNLATVFGLAMLTGLVLDYGIFALHNARQGGSSGMVRAMVLSALTTVFASGTLLFSRHPVMFHTGLVLSFGISVTALTALYCVPALFALLPRRLRGLLLMLPLLLAISGCATFSGLDVSEARAFEERFHAPQTRLYTIKTSILWYDFTILTMIKTTPGTLQAIGMTPAGMTIFNTKIENGIVTRRQFNDIVPKIAQERLFGTLARDLANVFLTDDYAVRSYGGNPVHMTEKRMGSFPQRRWKAVYYGWQQESGAFQRITYHNYDSHTTFTFEPK